MKTKTILLFFVALALSLAATTAHAAIDTLKVHSAKMNLDVDVIAVTPDNYDASGATAYPVVYLLHGAGGNHFHWLGIKGRRLSEIATAKGMIFVCPSARNSWYWDSPVDPKLQYETFVARELTAYIDKNYRTKADRTGRAITGLSMGGHGGLYLSMRNKDIFGAAGSTSGGVDIRPFPPTHWDMDKALGEFNDQTKALWDEHTVMVQADGLKNGELAIIFDCGFDDFFFEVNNALHAKLLAMKIDHDYIVRPGGHNGEYWNNALDFQLLFFEKFFVKNAK